MLINIENKEIKKEIKEKPVSLVTYPKPYKEEILEYKSSSDEKSVKSIKSLEEDEDLV